MVAKQVLEMSRSKRKTPVVGITTAPSEKQDKRHANRMLRRRVKQQLNDDHETDLLPLEREVSSIWTMDKDGKQRFDPDRHPNLMRK
jgi:hypothetical protein